MVQDLAHLILLDFIILIILLLLFIWTANGYLPSSSGTIIGHRIQIHISAKMTHQAQTKHSKQGYKNNKGHITDNKYNAKEVQLFL
jgi:hypothetical protein